MAQLQSIMTVSNTLAAVKSADWTSELAFTNLPPHGILRRVRVRRTIGAGLMIAVRILRSTGATAPPDLLKELAYQDEIDAPLDLGYLAKSLQTSQAEAGYTGAGLIIAVRADTGVNTAVVVDLELEER